MSLNVVRFDTRTTKLDPQEERYWLHALQGDPIVGDYIRSQMRLNPTFNREIFNQPVCEKCERIAFHHKNGVMCATCGHWSTGKTHKIKIHLSEGHYK